ncbi:MAG: extracellular solute-binding protein [Treponema sp.]|jgi:putative aldouronate transport system substrate-binding protein|nr:extracellular solute-binding protein [Treponema sp.]
MKRIVSMLAAMLWAGSLVFANGGREGQTAPASGTPVKISVEVFDRGTDGGKSNPTNNQWTKWIHDKLLKDENIDVTFVAVPRWSEETALVNLFAAGTPPDVCYSYNNDNIQGWANQGGLFDVAPYISTTLKDLNAFLGEDKAIPGKLLIEREIDLSTGAIYHIPARRMALARTVLFMREDWLKILKLPVPKTTEEFHKTLLAFRDRADELMAATGVSRIVPANLGATRIDWAVPPIIESFIDPNLSMKDRWINTVISSSTLLPGFKEAIRFINTLYNENLLDRDFPLYAQTTGADDLLKSGQVGAYINEWDDIYREPNGKLSGLKANIPTANLIPVDCFTNSNGQTVKPIYDQAGLSYFIPASSKNHDAAMRYLNWLAKYDNYHFLQVGHEGITHTIGTDRVVKVDATAKADPTWIMNSNQNIDYTMPMNGLFLETEEASILALAAGYVYPAELIKQAYGTALKDGVSPPVVKTSSPLTVAGPLNQTLVDKGGVFLVDLETCSAAQFDTKWDAGLKDWLASGAQAVIDERRAKYP